MSMTVSDLLGKKHSIDRAEQTLKTVQAAVRVGNIRLAVSRGITAIVHATAAAYKAPAPIIRRAEGVVQEVRNIIQGAIIKRVTLGLEGLGARPKPDKFGKFARHFRNVTEVKYTARPSKYIRHLREEAEIENRASRSIEPLIEFKVRQAVEIARNQILEEVMAMEEADRPSDYIIGLRLENAARVATEEVMKEAEDFVKEAVDKELFEQFLEEEKRDWKTFVNVEELFPKTRDVATLVDRGQSIVQQTINDQSLPVWYRLGRIVAAATLFKSAERMTDPKHAGVIRETYRMPAERLIKTIRNSGWISAQTKKEPAVISIPTPGDPYALKTRNLLISVLGLSEKAQRDIVPSEDGMQIYGTESAKEVLKGVTLLRNTFPWLQKTLMGISYSA